MSLPVAVVTGTNSGLGLALSVLLGKTHQVYAGMRSVSKKDALVEAASKAGVEKNIKVMEMDVNSDSSVSKAFEEIEKESGRVDVLVNNAGYSVFGSVEMLPMEKMKEQFETNLYGVIRCQKGALPMMRKAKSGKIINISSVGGVWGQPFNDIYCASKFALEGLSESQAALFRTFGVRVTCVEPGAIKSAFFQNAQRPDMSSLPAEYLKPIQSTIAAYQSSESVGQTPEELAAIIVEKVVEAADPPLRLQTNPTIQSVFEMQLKNPSGEPGVTAGASRFLKDV
uniref:Uncharacterized protein n=1 Tax=Chromera velia CCMP2878 TaxID=1169474 RepID=A0A0G4G637_9ALVE|eukprot:Cvel_4203.t1-p1 / transcript=Cvel_4203.t1 / gene=Cvel_4203 / organism=Chromera_velia_CCMP2878 / gene_product=Retinol dehydrogenase 8, putative / transcript_product=Retinol dehydrogenase 8, putative / location=Cvel_scaffold181:84432-85277(+) / protein_length=282 / sequence_SO=supercontig / SO=protein_coding / is_pseudo=false